MQNNHWIIAWRSHVQSGRAELCGYESGLNTCSKPNVEGHQVIDCVRCTTGTQQNRFARFAHQSASSKKKASH